MGESTMELVKRWRRATILAVVTAVIFWVGFQLSKNEAISAISPFADDPYDAVGSIAIQVAGFAGILSLARVLRLRPVALNMPSYEKLRFIRNGDIVVVLAVAATLVTDVVAILQRPAAFALSGWFLALLGGLAVVASSATASAIALARALRGAASSPAQAEAVSHGTELGDAIDDVLRLVLMPVRWLERRVPATGAISRSLAALLRIALRPFRWLDPHQHPWRFAVAFAVIVGIGLAAAHYVFEGPAPDPQRTITVSAFFFGVEMIAVLGCYLVFGGVLGLRPPLLPGRLRGATRPAV